MNPGIYDDLSNDEYHAQTDWVSSSMLKTHLPEHFRPHGTSSRDALDFGTAFHTTLLGVGEAIRPVPFLTWQGKEAREQRILAYSAGEVPILDKDLPRLEAMATAVKNHAEASELLLNTPSRHELSVFADVDGVPCKARFDALNDNGIAVDLKTTSAQPGEFALTRAVIDFGYDVSADHYLRVAEAAGLEVGSFVHVFVGKEPPHYVTVIQLDGSFFDRANTLRELALDRWANPDYTETYPGARTRLTLSTPRWAQL